MTQLIMSIEFCQNTAVSHQAATEAEAQVSVQTKVVEALKAQLLLQAEKLSEVTNLALIARRLL